MAKDGRFHRNRRTLGVLAMGLGLGLILGSALLTIGNVRESDAAGDYARGAGLVLEERMEASPMAQYLSNPEFIPDYKLNPGMPMPVSEIDGAEYVGCLTIPALDIELGVQSEWSYSGLKKSPCRFAGSAYTGDLVICAHNYKTHFGSIGSLAEGDRVAFQDMDGNVFEYAVAEVGEIAPVPDTQVVGTGHDLVLFTCTLGGRTRVVVYCDLI